MDFPIRTLGQLRPILQGFRKTAGLTQAGMASHLGVTQQTYAQLEANPAAVSVDRLFRVLGVLQVDLILTPRAAGSAQGDVVEDAMLSAPITQPARKTAAPRPAQKDSTATTRNVKAKTQPARQQKTEPTTPARVKSLKTKTTPQSATKSRRVSKQREEW